LSYDFASGMDRPKWWDVPYAVPGPNLDHTQFVRIHVSPDTSDGVVHGTVIVLHGGYWKNRYGLGDEYGNAGTASVTPFFLARGFSVVEVEYRRRDHEGGGWPGTNQDVLAAVHHVCALSSKREDAPDQLNADFQAALASLRPDRLILLGHSAGGCLALWAAHQMRVHGIRPVVLAAAPVADLVKGHELRVSDEGDAVELYMKMKPDSEGIAEYNKASPSALLPVTFPLCVVFGDADVDVPPELVRAYAQQAKSSAPELVSIVEIAEADHFDVVNASSECWSQHVIPALRDVVMKQFGESAAAALTIDA